MKPNEIKKAAKCCLDCDCHNCPYLDKENCEERLKKELSDLFNHCEKEIERLEAQIAVYEGWGKKNDF